MKVFLTVITTSQYWCGEGLGVLGRELFLCAFGEEPMDGEAWEDDANGHGTAAGGQTWPSLPAAAALGHRGVIGCSSSKELSSPRPTSVRFGTENHGAAAMSTVGITVVP